MTSTSSSSPQPSPNGAGVLEVPDERPLRIVVVGHVDHGKSTLIGRLFHDTGSLPDGKLEAIQATCKRRGVPFEWAFLMDALQSERDQNITIDSAQIWFRTQARPYVIIDAPGHREFLKNMITGAAAADAALLLIAANEGVREQSRRHGYLLSLLGIEQVVVAVNKMDLVDYDQGAFDDIEAEFRAFLGRIGITPQRFVPISARGGQNIAHAAVATEMPWYDGPTVLEALDRFDMPARVVDQPLRFPIQDVYRFDIRRILAGRIEAGTLRVGERLQFAPGGESSVVRSIERWGTGELGANTDLAVAGESIGITLEDQLFVERGHVAARADSQPQVTNRLRANVFWMGRQPLVLERVYKLKLSTQEVDCRIARIERVIDASSLANEQTDLSDGPDHVDRNDVAELVLETKFAVAVDRHADIETTGRFVIVDGFDVAGGGIVIDTLEPHEGWSLRADGTEVTQASASGTSTGLTQSMAVGQERAGALVWLRGPVTVAASFGATLRRALGRVGQRAFVLEADTLADGLNQDLAPTDRHEAARRALHAARLVALSGSHAIVCAGDRLARPADTSVSGVARVVDIVLSTDDDDAPRLAPPGSTEAPWRVNMGRVKTCTVTELTELVVELAG